MIYKKLMEFQKKEITLVKDTTNPFYNSKYATLNQVLEKVRKPLMDMGILIFQYPVQNGLVTKLLDLEDDTEVECLFPFTELTTAQKVGAGITYGRRYSLVALLGLEDMDDDGNTASTVSTPVSPKTAPRTQGIVKKTVSPVDPMSTLCDCGQAVKRAQTKKAGKNFGRWFLTCPKPMGKQCGYFQFEDERLIKASNLDLSKGYPRVTPDEYAGMSKADQQALKDYDEEDINAELAS